MRKKLLAFVATTALLAGIGVPLAANADPDLNDKKTAVDKKIEESNRQIAIKKDEVKTAEQRIKEAQDRLDTAKAELKKIRDDLGVAKEADAKLAAELEAAQAELAKAKAETTAGRERVEGQQAVIGRAVRDAYQQRSDLTGVGVLIGSENPRDLASRLQWKQTIFSSTAAELDRLTTLVRQLEQAEATQAEIEKTITEKKQAAEQALARIASLEAKSREQNRLIATRVAENEEVRKKAGDELAEEMKHNAALASESEAIAAQIRAELAAKPGGQTAPNVDVPRPSSGLIRPVDGWISSSYGYRTHPVTGNRSFHSGTDFANNCGVPIKAAAAGKVKMASWNGGYGNYVRLDHGVIGGKALTTAYGHLSRYAVSAGANVQQGQVIGYVGTTGMSTGCHLHFEVWVNGSTVNPMSYV